MTLLATLIANRASVLAILWRLGVPSCPACLDRCADAGGRNPQGMGQPGDGSRAGAGDQSEAQLAQAPRGDTRSLGDLAERQSARVDQVLEGGSLAHAPEGVAERCERFQGCDLTWERKGAKRDTRNEGQPGVILQDSPGLAGPEPSKGTDPMSTLPTPSAPIQSDADLMRMQDALDKTRHAIDGFAPVARLWGICWQWQRSDGELIAASICDVADFLDNFPCAAPTHRAAWLTIEAIRDDRRNSRHREACTAEARAEREGVDLAAEERWQRHYDNGGR